MIKTILNLWLCLDVLPLCFNLEIMKKRSFLKSSSLALVGIVAAPILGCKRDKKESIIKDVTSDREDFILPELGFDFNAMEPNIDAQTMEIHHDKHHAGYVRKLNAALKGNSIKGNSLEVCQ